jgi:hypothetical protein
MAAKNARNAKVNPGEIEDLDILQGAAALLVRVTR